MAFKEDVLAAVRQLTSQEMEAKLLFKPKGFHIPAEEGDGDGVAEYLGLEVRHHDGSEFFVANLGEGKCVEFQQPEG